MPDSRASSRLHACAHLRRNGNSLLPSLVLATVIATSFGADAATITVDSALDQLQAGNGACTLREAIANAEANTDTTSGDCAPGQPGADVIVFAAALNGAALVVSSPIEISNDPLSIVGPGAELLALEGGGSLGIIAAEPPLAISGLQFRNAAGSAVVAGRRLQVDACAFVSNTGFDGGAIAASTAQSVGPFDWQIEDSVFRDNRSTNPSQPGGGGAIRFVAENATATLALRRNLFLGNTSAVVGGAVDVEAGHPGSALVMEGNRFEGNAAPFAGGGLHAVVSGNLVLRGDVFSGNTSIPDEYGGFGGGALASSPSGRIEVDGAIFEGNRAHAGGGLLANGVDIQLMSSTFRDNAALGDTAPDQTPAGPAPCGAEKRRNAKRPSKGFSPSTFGPGGGGALLNALDISITGTLFEDNCANALGGGVFAATYGGLVIDSHTRAQGNRAGRGGGGIYLESAELAGRQVMVSIGASVDENVVHSGDGGGVLAVGLAHAEGFVLTFESATISGNTASGHGGGVAIEGRDRSADAPFAIEVRNSLLRENVAGGSGGAIGLISLGRMLPFGGGEAVRFLGPDLHVDLSRIIDNQSGAGGGGIAVIGEDAGRVAIERSLVGGNGTAAGGGGVAVLLPGEFGSIEGLAISASTLAGNSGVDGGGLHVLLGDVASSGSTSLVNATLHGNTATGDGGGAALLASEVAMRFVTISANSALGSGGGLRIAGSATLTLDDCIVAGNAAGATGADASGALTANHCLFGSTAGATLVGAANLLDLDPMLGLLADNGGPTPTRLPLPGSPVRNAGNPAFSPPPAVDQRGSPRLAEGRVDLGAVESGAPLPELSIADASALETSGSMVFTVTLSSPTGHPVSVDYATTDGSAVALVDYVAQSGRLDFAPGQSSASISVAITVDAISEPDETFSVDLSNAVGATIARGRATGTILGAVSAAAPATIPTLQPWALLLLALMLGGIAACATRPR